MAKVKVVEEVNEENPFGPITHIIPDKPPLAVAPPKPVKRVLITGSRTHWEFDLITGFVANLIEKYPDAEFLCGGSKGCDAISRWLLINTFGKKVETIAANWDEVGVGAGFARNWQLVIKADVVAALWDGSSKGTSHTIQAAKRLKKTVLVWEVPAVPEVK